MKGHHMVKSMCKGCLSLQPLVGLEPDTLLLRQHNELIYCPDRTDYPTWFQVNQNACPFSSRKNCMYNQDYHLISQHDFVYSKSYKANSDNSAAELTRLVNWHQCRACWRWREAWWSCRSPQCSAGCEKGDSSVPPPELPTGTGKQANHDT